MVPMIDGILGIIPARGGSKAIPGKNIFKIKNKPLIAWTIEAALQAKYICDTVVSSDDDTILEISESFGAQVLKRPKELAMDDSSSEMVVEYVLNTLIKKYKYCMLLQPTSPLRDSRLIDKAVELFFESDATALISVCEIDNKILKAFKENENGYIEGVANNIFPFMPRQNLPKTFISNGAIYLIKTDEFLKNRSFLATKTIKFIMNERESLDIDDYADIEKFKSYLE